MPELKIDLKTLPPALQTAFSYLAEGNWRNANDCFDLALKQSPLDPYACLGKAMTACYLKTPEELDFSTDDLLENPFFSAALKYAEGDLKDQLTQLVVRLNYEKQQKAQQQESAIQTEAASAETGATEGFAGAAAENETPESASKANWDYAGMVEGVKPAADAAAAAPAAPEAAAPAEGETVDVVKGKKKGKKKLIVALVVLLVLLLGGGAAGTYFYLIPLMKYNKAIDLINAKQYDEGLAMLDELGDFSDAPQQYQTGLYVKALNYLANDDFEHTREILEQLGDFKDAPELLGSLDARRVSKEVRAVAATPVGEVVTFGHYETDGDTENGEEALRWIVLSNRDDLVTLITEQSIAGMRYHFNASETNWAECSLRSWLNGTFYTSAFDLTEADFICKNYITTPANPDFPSPNGEATVDKVYLLSMNEALQYFRTLSDRKLTCTTASYTQTYTNSDDFCCWWLRTPGARLESAVGVDPTGQVMTVGYDCYKNDQIGVRPVIVIDISAVGDSGSASSGDAATATSTDAAPGSSFGGGTSAASETTTASRSQTPATTQPPTTASSGLSQSTTKPAP